MMRHFFGVRGEECRYYRDKLTIEKPYKARNLPHKAYAGVVVALNGVRKERGFENVEPKTLLEIAKTHQVSLRALWNQMKEWDSHE